jgi:LysR family transcriptional regulator, glycine cleavage system transcriptional activator
MKHLPSIRSLMAFEAIARHQSVSRAASELNITQAAASIRLKGLEEHLGFPLFLRSNGHFALTEAGGQYLASVHKVITELSDAAERATRPAHSVRLCAPIALAQKWLIPRLTLLMRRAPDVEIDLQVAEDETDASGSNDLVVRHRAAGAETAIKLMDDEFIAVGKPEIVEQLQSFRPTELKAVKWLREAPSRTAGVLGDPLVDWLHRIGLGFDDVGPRVAFSNPSLVVDAALHGVGIALVRHSLAVDHIEQRQLARLFHHSVPGAEPIYLAMAPGRRHDRRVGRIRDWLLEQADMRRQLMVPQEVPRSMRLSA